MGAPAISERWVVRPRNVPRARVRLFCFPYAGGGASAFNGWADQVPADVEICAIQLPGRETRINEEPFARLEPMIEAAAGAVVPYDDLPFAFFGHCLGALIAFELARRLGASVNSGLRHLFVAGCRAPQLPRVGRSIHTLPDSAFIERLRELKQTPEILLHNSELMSLYLPALRADFGVWETYVYADGEPLACPISAFGGMEDAKLTPDAVQPWRAQTRNAFVRRALPGNHFFLHSSRPLLLQLISDDLRHTLRLSHWEAELVDCDRC
jgi:medium-chain acyl-[acyl-carrier-protein] hydrolase